jgi:hemoglobin/transferrin/lactoferrin receptor protein
LPAFSQIIYVLDKSTLQPVEQAVISAQNIHFEIITDNKGKADITCCASSDTLVVRALGYATRQIAVSELEKTNFKILLSAETFSIDEIVVSSSRFEEKKRDVPQQIEVIKRRDIEFANLQTTADLLQNTGNVFVQKSQAGGGSPVLRGFEASRVLIVIDGVRMNNAIYRAGHLQNIIRIDQNMLERAEVLFGPGSVIYGSDALGGVMHLQSRNPLLSSDNKLLVKAQAFGRYSTANQEKTGHVDLNVGLNKIGFLTSFTYSDFGDVRQGHIRNPLLGNRWDRVYFAQRVNGKDSMMVNADPNIQKQSAYMQYDLLQKILINPNERWSHVFNIQFSNTGDVPRYDRLSELRSGKLRFAEWYYGPEQRLLASYRLEWNATNKAFDRMRILPAFQKIQESRHSRNFGNKWRRSQIEDVMVYSLNADFSKHAGQHKIRYGAEFTYNDVQSTAHFTNIEDGEEKPANTRYPDRGSKFLTAAAFVTDNWELHEKLILSAGFRFSYVGLHAEFRDTTFYKYAAGKVSQRNAAPSGSLGLIYLPGQDWRLALSFATGFRSPNVDDLGKVFDSAPGLLIVPNPNIKPEYTYNIDLNVSKIFWERLYLEMVGWFTYYDNAIALRAFRLNGADSIMYDGVYSRIVANQNVNKAYLTGAGFNARFDANNFISFSQSFNYTYGSVIDSVYVPLDHIPPAYGRSAVMVHASRVRTEFYLLYNGWKRLKHYSASGEDNLQYATPFGMPAWFTLNFKASVQIVRQLQLQAGVENILDYRYRTFASGISAPGRNVYVTLRLKI